MIHPGEFKLELQREGLPRVWMYGGGRQSACIAVLIKRGLLPVPDYATIADTGREKLSTWLYLKNVVQPALNFQIHIVSKSEFATVDLWGGKDKDTLLIPAYTNQSGEVGKLETFCSNEWKTRVIERWLGRRGVGKFEKWVGFSLNEKKRWGPMKKYHGDTVRFPLVDDFPSTTEQAVEIVRSEGWPPPPQSSCWMCPNMRDQEWKKLSPEEFEKACQFDEEIRTKDPHAYLHPSCTPLRQVKFSKDGEDRQCDKGVCFV